MTTASALASTRSYRSRNPASSAALTMGPASWNEVALRSARLGSVTLASTTVKVRRVSPLTGAKAAVTPSASSAAVTPAPVIPPASPVTSTSAPRAASVRATFRPLPPGRSCTAPGRFTPPHSTSAT